jgi:general secretion pathway protein G
VLKHLRNSEAFEQKNLLEKGFTLVELLVVIVILGILAAVVVFAVGGSTDDAQNSACKAELSSAQAAVEAYAAQNTGSYPTKWADVTKGTATTNPDGKSNGFLRSAPTGRFTLSATGGSITGVGKCAGIDG